MQKRRKQTRFKELAAAFEKLEHTGSSNTMVNILAEFLPNLSPQEIKITAYLLRGEVGPSFEALEFNLAQNMVIRALTQAYQLPEQKIKIALFKFGDLGIVAENLSKRKGDHLTITEVFNSLQEITRISGKGSQKLKLDRLVELLSQASGQEAKYIVRTILGTHRIGVADMTFLSGLAQGFTGKRENKAVLESAYNIMSDLGEVAFRLTDKGLDALKQVLPVPGIPIRMMLASRVADLDEVSSHITDSMFVEYKYDGERVQIHKDKRGGITAYSRRLENITNQYPEIIEQARKSLSAKEAIVEGEVVAIDPKTKKLQAFQVLMQRKRKHEIERYRREVPITLFLFDLLYVSGKSLLQLPLSNRKQLLAQSIKEGKNINIGRYIETEEIAKARVYFQKALADGSEGVIIKAAKSPYQAGKRGWYWIKFKREYQTELADTFDVVIIGALYGRGRRVGSFGSVLVACFDPKTNKYYSFTKVGAGLTDTVLKSLPKILKPYIISKKHRQVETNMEADIWFEPVKVIEISGAQLTISPVHAVAKDKLKKGGLALRFPKFLHFREDKSAEQATTVQEVWDMYKFKGRS